VEILYSAFTKVHSELLAVLKENQDKDVKGSKERTRRRSPENVASIFWKDDNSNINGLKH